MGIFEVRGGSLYRKDAATAAQISFDNSGTGLTATNAQDAISEINSDLADKIPKSDIANNLTTATAGKVLDATQGKALKDEADKFFVLANNSLSFNSTTKIATVSDARVTASTYAMVYFTDATLAAATAADIVVDTISGAVQFTAQTLPTSTLVCDIVCKKA